MTKDITQKLKDWREIHELFLSLSDFKREDYDELHKKYHAKAYNYETKYGEVCNPLLRPQ